VSLWLLRHRTRSFLRNSLWFFPVLGIFIAIGAIDTLHAIEKSQGLVAEHAPAAISLVLSSLASAVFTLIVFVASALLITMQLASAQLTPRVIGLIFRDRPMKGALTLSTFAFTFTLAALLRIDEEAHAVTTATAAWSCVASLAIFLFLVDHVGRTLRPSGTLLRVARHAHGVIEQVYPRLFTPGADRAATAEPPPKDRARIVTSRTDGVVQALDSDGLLALARRAGAVIELVPQVGDFVPLGSPLFRVHGGTASPAEAALRGHVALGQERTHEQDPAFAFRVVVDVACKALSPAVNDPTTAVTAIDCVHKLLSDVAARNLDQGRLVDEAGTLRVLYRTPDWEDFVRLAITEIRQFGSESIQVSRRLLAMIESLIESVPAQRAPALREELKLLRRTAARSFDEPEDRALAAVGDQQGVGGAAKPAPPDTP
jgi:uncharacterized membrane protein